MNKVSNNQQWNLEELKSISNEIRHSLNIIIQQYIQQQKVEKEHHTKTDQEINNNNIVSEDLFKITVNALHTYETLIKGQLKQYTKSFSECTDFIAKSVLEIFKYCWKANNFDVDETENPVQKCWNCVKDHQSNQHSQNLIHSLSCVYYTMFQEYLDQFNYFQEQVDPTTEYSSDDERDEEIAQSIPTNEKFIPNTQKSNSNSKLSMITRGNILQFIATIIPSLSTLIWLLYGAFYTWTISKRELKSTGAKISYTEESRFIVIDLLAEIYKLYLLGKTFLWRGGLPALINYFALKYLIKYFPVAIKKIGNYLADRKLAKENAKNNDCLPNAKIQMNAEGITHRQLNYHIMKIRNNILRAVEIIKNHAKCMQRILHLLKNLNERQLFMNYISLTPSKRQYRQKKVPQKNVKEITNEVNQSFYRISAQFLEFSKELELTTSFTIEQEYKTTTTKTTEHTDSF